MFFPWDLSFTVSFPFFTGASFDCLTMGRLHGQTKFQISWTETFSRVQPCDDCYSAKCTSCKSTFSVQSMGRQALVSHKKGKKHQEQMRNKDKTTPLHSFFNQAKQTQPPSSQLQSSAPQLEPSTSHPSINQTSACRTQPLTTEVPEEALPNTQLPLRQLYAVKEDVTRAEILWCLQSVVKHQSLREAVSCVSLFKVMFPSCEIANSMNLHKSKMSYLAVYGLGHHFQSELLKHCAPALSLLLVLIKV